MPQSETPSVSPGGLVTVAFLKAQLDGGSDHLGIFMPLVLDVLARLEIESFTTGDIQEALAASHGVAMPQQTVTTLLKRAIRQRYLRRESGRYWPGSRQVPPSSVTGQKAQIEAGQQRLADALRRHAQSRGLTVESTDAAQELLFKFLEDEQIAMLLGSPPAAHDVADASLRERTVVAEFLQVSVKDDPDLVVVLRGMLEGLVFYHAAFLPDLSVASRRFKDLRVLFDSALVRQALGYEGLAMRTLMRETIDVLKAGGVQCLVLDKSVHEIQRILAMYEVRLATSEGCRSLRAIPMARHFMTQRYSPSDVREMSALLDREIVAAGFQILSAPARVREYTAGEKALAARLADPAKGDEMEPRVVHDVDCVAAVLTLRRGHRSTNLDDARSVFATSSPLVIRNARAWWDEDEHETGVEPVIHIRALANLAWLKKPSLCADFKVRELVALCSAALRPTLETWERFKRHLDSLHRSQRLSSDEVTAVLVSTMSDGLLKEAEFEEGDASDIDAVTLDEVVSRVTASYAANAEEQRRALTNDYDGKLAEVQAREHDARQRAEAVERTVAEESRRRGMVFEGRARKCAHYLSHVPYWAAMALVGAGAIALVLGHPFHGGLTGTLIGIPLAFFIILEAVGILRHMSEWRDRAELGLTKVFRKWFEGGD